MNDQLDELSRLWNGPGRRFAADVQARLERFHRGEVDDPGLPADPRSESLGTRVLDAVVELNRLGRWREARRWLDPAHAPFIPSMDSEEMPFVVALGRDEALFRRGSTYQPGHLWHVAGDTLTPLPRFLAAAISPSREMLALVDTQGVRVLRGLNGPEVTRLPWPKPHELVPSWVPQALRDRYLVDPPATSLESLCVADCGLRVAIAVRSGVLVGDARNGPPRWHLVLPRSDAPNAWRLEDLEKGETTGFHGDMVHVAMTGDGGFIACGTQVEGHYVFKVDHSGQPTLWSHLGHASEYPHNACFSADGAQVALNSCHFYNGATIAASVVDTQGLAIEPYREDEGTPVINNYLRVYASTWLPESATHERQGAFALAGASLLTIVTPTGRVLHELLFGSSASGIDYCPRAKILVLGSYSGFLHFLDPAELDPNGIGYRPPSELKRWCFLKDRAPFQW